MATSADQINTAQLTQLMILNLGSRNACMRALIAHPTDLNAAANWLINHRTDANIDQDPFAQQATTTTTNTTTTTTNITTTNTNTNYNPYAMNNTSSTTTTTNTQQHSQQHMIQQVMNLGYTRDEALRAYTNISTTDRNDTNKLVEYLVKNPKKEDKKTYNTYSNTNSSYYPYSNSNKKKVYRPVINIDDIKVDKEKICDLDECEAKERIGIVMREYKKFIENTYKKDKNDNDKCDKNKDYEKNGFYSHFISTINGEEDEEEIGYPLCEVMDDFIHLVFTHDVRYGEFNKVSKYMLCLKAMDGKLDKEMNEFILQRNRFCHDDGSKINELYFGFKSVKEITIQQLCDKMYCYFTNSYDIASKLNKKDYRKLDKQFGLQQNENIDLKDNNDDDKEKDISSLIKEKTIRSYVGNKYFIKYAKLLEIERENWFKLNTNDIKHQKYNKFYRAFDIKNLEKRVEQKK